MPYRDLEKRRAAAKRYYREHRDERLKYARDHYEPTPRAAGLSVTDNAAYQRAWAANNPEKARAHARKYYLKTYGLTEEKYQEILAAQGGICALCSKDDPDAVGRKLHIDHDHQTGRVRGLLCSMHNTGLGKLGDSIEGLLRAIEYLRRNLHL